MELLSGPNDFVTSVEKALEEIDPAWRSYPGLLVVGSHAPSEVESKIEAIKNARWTNVPVLGICFGMQLMAIEYARNQGGIQNATSEEFNDGGTPVVIKLPELRVGIRPVEWKGRRTMESHWHNYAVNVHAPTLREVLERDFLLTYCDGILEVMQHRDQTFYTGVQFHPEYGSSKGRAHPLLVDFIKACKKHSTPST